MRRIFAMSQFTQHTKRQFRNSAVGQECNLFDRGNTASLYLKCRPTYPDELYKTIINFYKRDRGPFCNFQLAVDVGCGNGQSTLPLCKYFKQVIGCDVSEKQLALAPQNISNAIFKLCDAECMDFVEEQSVDLVTCGLSLHWIDRNRFYPEIRRVLKSGGVFTAYGYDFTKIQLNEKAQKLVDEFCENLLFPYVEGPAWLVPDHYRDITCPFEPFEDWTRIENEALFVRNDMSVEAFIGLVKSMAEMSTSVVQHPNNQDLNRLQEQLQDICKGATMSVKMPVFMLICRNKI